MDFTWLVTWSGFKRFWRKRIYRLKNCLLVIIIFYNKDHQLSIARSSSCSCWDHFSFLFASHHYLNWWHLFSFWTFFFLNFWFGSSWCAPFLFFFIDLLSWTEFQHVDDPCLGYFWKKFSIFQAQRGCNGILMMFQDEQTWPYITLNYDCLIFKEINSRNRFQRFPILVIFFWIVLSFA